MRMAIPLTPTPGTERTQRRKVEIYNRFSFSTTSTREELSSDYFAIADGVEADIMMPFVTEMKVKHKKCPYWKLLKHYCPCAVDNAVRHTKSKRAKFPKPSQRVLLANHSSIESVHSFVCAVLKRLIPLELFGNMANRKTLFRNIQWILNVHKYGEVSLDYLIREVKVSKIPWLSHLNHPEQRENLLKCVDFLVTKVVCPLIKSFFFIVESSYAKIKLFIFRKRVWHRLRQKAFVKFVKFCRLNVIAKHKVEDLIKQGKCLGFSTLNFVLKKTSLRPICNLSAHHDGKLSINSHLTSLLVVLNYEKTTNAQNFGATAMGLLDFHKKFRKYVMTVRREQFKRFHFVTADIEKCFDSIQPSLLLKIAFNLFKSDVYIVNKYKGRYFRNKQCVTYFESVQGLQEIQHRHGDVEYISRRAVRKKTLMKSLECLLVNNVLKVGNIFYIQKKGISQGSKISSVLCAAYLSHVEKEINIAKGLYDFFVRIEDEYLFVSTMKSSAQDFLTNLITNLPKFGCKININKCASNFDCDFGPNSGKVPKASKIKFFGLFLDPINFFVSSDYSRYEGLKASDVVTCRLNKNPGTTLRETVVRSLYPKCYTILFDANINSHSVIERNVLQIFCMTAVKFHFLVLSLPHQKSVDKNPRFFLETILGLPALLHEYICNSSRKVISSDQYNDISHLPISIKIVISLCHNAFLYKLRKNPELYCNIIESLEKELSHYPEIPEHSVCQAFRDIFFK